MEQLSPSTASSATNISYSANQYCIFPQTANYNTGPFPLISLPSTASNLVTPTTLPFQIPSLEIKSEVAASSRSSIAGDSEVPTDSAYSSEHENTPEQQGTSSISNQGISVNNNDEELWKSFHKIGNEMIVTRPGRLDHAKIANYDISQFEFFSKYIHNMYIA